MNEKNFNNNQVDIVGKVISNLAFSHETFGEKFYICDVEVKRLSEVCDKIPLMVSEQLIDVHKDYKGMFVYVTGQFRSYNRHEDSKSKLELSIFAHGIEVINEFPETVKTNHISLDGYLCKPPVYRTTPAGKEISDIILAVNRPYGKSDYIPCICWGKNAKFVESLSVGDRIRILGRIQSRKYQKKTNEDNTEIRIAYEISVSKLKHK